MSFAAQLSSPSSSNSSSMNSSPTRSSIMVWTSILEPVEEFLHGSFGGPGRFVRVPAEKFFFENLLVDIGQNDRQVVEVFEFGNEVDGLLAVWRGKFAEVCRLLAQSM